MVKILIADDHSLFREGLRLVLGQLGSDLVIVEAGDFLQALQVAASEADLGIILLDLSMPGMTWTESLKTLRTTVPHVPVVILSASEARHLVRQAIDLGASGFIPKSSNSKVMLDALRLVLSGGIYLPDAVIEHEALPERLMPGVAINPAAAAVLTPRQREVLSLVGEGRSNKEIARQLVLSEGTVKLHVTAILKALKVNNRTRAVVAASQFGLASSRNRDGEPIDPKSDVDADGDTCITS